MTPERERAELIIAAYRELFVKAEEEWRVAQERAKTISWLQVTSKPRINWTEDWDGLLVLRTLALADHGYWVTQIYRKQKISFRMPVGKTRQMIANDMFLIFGNSFNGLTFNRCAIWWGITGSKYGG